MANTTEQSCDFFIELLRSIDPSKSLSWDDFHQKIDQLAEKCKKLNAERAERDDDSDEAFGLVEEALRLKGITDPNKFYTHVLDALYLEAMHRVKTPDTTSRDLIDYIQNLLVRYKKAHSIAKPQFHGQEQIVQFADADNPLRQLLTQVVLPALNLPLKDFPVLVSGYAQKSTLRRLFNQYQMLSQGKSQLKFTPTQDMISVLRAPYKGSSALHMIYEQYKQNNEKSSVTEAIKALLDGRVVPVPWVFIFTIINMFSLASDTKEELHDQIVKETALVASRQ